MGDLESKFTGIEAQLNTQHEEILAALNTIAFALGAPPSAPTITLATISNQLTALNNNLIGIAIANGSFHSALLSALAQINVNTDTLINNNSLNTQRLLIAIAANDPCKSCDIVAIEPPPIDITPQLVDQDHCKRMQALIYALRRFTVKLDVLSSFGLGFSPTVIRDAITEIITELGVTELLEYPSLGEVAQIAGAAAAYVVSSIFASNSLPAAFLSIEDALLPALYAADNASAGQAAYRSVLAGSSLSTPIVNLFQAMAYTSIFNLYYDSTIELDVSGYDGTICIPDLGDITDCTTFASQAYSGTYGAFQVVISPPIYTDNDIFTAGDFIGYTIRLLSFGGNTAIRCDYYDASNGYNGGTLLTAVDQVATFSAHTTAIGCHTNDANVAEPFTIELCPPEPE